MDRSYKPLYMDVYDVMSITGTAKSKAYAIIRAVNADLVKMGKMTVAGKAPRRLILDKLGIEGGDFDA